MTRIGEIMPFIVSAACCFAAGWSSFSGYTHDVPALFLIAGALWYLVGIRDRERRYRL
jgi:hypothetical protein